MILFFNLKICLKTFSRIFQEYSRTISQKVVTKVVKNKENVAHVISFALGENITKI
jgi:hypothetical protein